MVIRLFRCYRMGHRYNLLHCVSFNNLFMARKTSHENHDNDRFRDLDRREEALNRIGKGDRAGFVDER